MKILHLSTTENAGGAGLAANRLHSGLLAADCQSRMLVQYKYTNDSSVYGAGSRTELVYRMKGFLDSIPCRFYTLRKNTPFTPAWITNANFEWINEFNPDVVHLHWTGRGFLSIESIKTLDRPIVWTLHDMWPFTGGCHYAGDCKLYMSHCEKCPQLGSENTLDLSHRVMKRKLRNWENAAVTAIAPSRWMGECAGGSRLFRDADIQIIPNGLDLSVYKPAAKSSARSLWSLADDRKYILFSAAGSGSTTRKGLHLLNETLEILAKKTDSRSIELVVFGAAKPDMSENCGFRINYVGELHDDISLATLYSAVDVFAAPSMEDNLPNTVIEAMACATPVVAYDIGGMPDMIDHEENGYLVAPYDAAEFARAIEWILENDGRHKRLSTAARKKAEASFCLQDCVEKYHSLYESLMC